MVQFRQFKEEDWGDYVELSEEAFPREMLNREIYLNSLENEGFVGAFVEDKFIGYLNLRVMGDYGHLGRIAVVKDERGKGYGKKLMDYSMNHFKNHNSKNIGLYVETKNDVALNLYHKYGFIEKYESWHYWVTEEQVKEIEERKEDSDSFIRVLKPEDFESIVNAFPLINIEELKVQLEKYQKSPINTSIPLGLYVDGRIRVYGRFNAIFSGCRPFHCTDVRYVDGFLRKLGQYREDKNYYRLTFEKNQDLARFFENQKYRLHHHMWFMEKEM